MFELTKFAGWFISPLPLFMLGAAWALLLAWRGLTRLGLSLGSLVFVVLLLSSTPWCAHTLAHGLELQYPAHSVAQTPKADAALVLGGVLGAADPPARPEVNLGPAVDRVWHAAALQRAGKVRWVLVSGGNQPGFEGVTSEAEAMRELLLTLGVTGEAIRLEGKSRNTEENARNSLELVRQVQARRVLLVTSALHMPRAMLVFGSVFRGTGVELLPASTDVEALRGGPHSVWQWIPTAGALAHSSRAIKEYLGLAYLHCKGWWS